MNVYADLVVVLNFLVDFLLLYGTNRLSGFPGNGKRAALGALLGAGYAGLCMVPGMGFLAGGFWYFLSFTGMILVAYGLQGSALRRGVLFFLLSMALGGISMGIGSTSLWALVLAGAGLWLLCMLGFPAEPGKSYLPVTISHRGKKVELVALVDTGNSLKDPLSGSPVLVVDGVVGQQLLGISMQELEKPMQTMLGLSYPGLRLIPYHAVGQPAGMLLAVKPDDLAIEGKKREYIVAFAPQRIGQGKGFAALAGGMA